MSCREKWILAGLMALLAYPAWFRGGTYVRLQGPLPWLGALVFVSIFLVPALCRRGDALGCVLARRAGRLLKDPVFYLGAVFLALLAVQWWNSGRQLVFDQVQRRWMYTPPPMSGLPSAITRPEAREMLYWFFPAWAAMLCVRSGVLDRKGLRTLYSLMVVNGALLATFGIVQYASGTKSIYWLQPMERYFFASFGYENHAGAYFTLMFCLSSGLLVRTLLRHHIRRNWKRASMLTACVLLNLLGANLSLSRSAIVVSWVMVAFVAVYAISQAWPVLRPVDRLNMVLAVGTMIVLGGLLVAGMGWDVIRKEIATLHPDDRSANLLGGEWALLRPAAFLMWRDHPWFGVGGWGFRYLLGWYIPPEQWSGIRIGDASVHNDALQFLAEFGAVGAGLMVAMIVMILMPILRSGQSRRPLVLIALVGLGVTVLQSMVDLPFRCPAVLYAWCVILAALPEIAAGSAHNHRLAVGSKPEQEVYHESRTIT